MTSTLLYGLASAFAAGLLWPQTAIWVRRENLPAAAIVGAIAAFNTFFAVLRLVELAR